MHESAFEKAELFRRVYLAPYESQPLTVLDVGSAVVAEGHPSNRQAMTNPNWRYVGLDIEAAPNVDVVVAEPYDWREVGDASVDVVTCSQVFEHTQFFWLTILEIGRVLKPGGLAFIVAPGSGPLHRYPLDCWRFYDDGLPSLAEWASLSVVEARVQWRPVYRKGNQWRDAAVLLQRPIRSPEEERRIARKTALVKAAHLGREPELAAPLPPAPGPIAILPAGSAMEAHEDALLKARSPLSYRASLVGQHLRSIRRLLSTSAEKIIRE
jgi:SAM-dependent methyltransferase